MMTFRAFLTEMPTLHAVNSQELGGGEIKPPSRYEKEEHLDTVGEYNLVGRRSDFGRGDKSPIFHYLAQNDDGETHFMSRGGTTKDNHFIANDTRKHPDSSINAIEFYKAILYHGEHHGIQSGADHSEGGQSIWERLHKDPEIEVTHHDKLTDNRIPLHHGDDFEKNYNQDSPTYFKARLRNT